MTVKGPGLNYSDQALLNFKKPCNRYLQRRTHCRIPSGAIHFGLLHLALF
jgi:hypothetical protein